MNKREKLIELYPESKFSFADGFDDAILGVEEDTDKVIYSVEKCLLILSKDMSYDDARDYFEYNVKGSKGGIINVVWCEDEFN
jgi:hypothetical protein